jgi:hypothetical protein
MGKFDEESKTFRQISTQQRFTLQCKQFPTVSVLSYTKKTASISPSKDLTSSNTEYTGHPNDKFLPIKHDV